MQGLNRVGTFFMLIGAVGLFLYILSDISESPQCNLLAGGIVLFGIGFLIKYLYRRTLPPPEPAPRFRVLGRLRKNQPKKQ